MSAPISQVMVEHILKTLPTAQTLMPQHMTENRLALIAVSIVFTSIGLLAMVFRLFTMFLRNRRFGKDDWCMLIAWLSSIGMMVASSLSVRWGVGLELKDVTTDSAIKALQMIYMNEIFYYVSLFFIKMSLLFLYLRLGTELRDKFFKLTLVMMMLIICHFVSTAVVIGLQCMPLHKYWEPATPGTCINITAFFYFVNAFTVVSDLFTIALPIPTIWKVQRPRAQRIELMAAFLIGIVSTFASCARLYSIRIYTTSSEPMRDAAPLNIWSFIEINLGILCASVPAIKPLFMAATICGRSQYYHHGSGDSQSSKRTRCLSVAEFLQEEYDDAMIESVAEIKEVKYPNDVAILHTHDYYDAPYHYGYDRRANIPRTYNRDAHQRRPRLVREHNETLVDNAELRLVPGPNDSWRAGEKYDDDDSSVESFGSDRMLVSTSLSRDEILDVMKGHLVIALQQSPRDELRELVLWPKNSTPRMKDRRLAGVVM